MVYITKDNQVSDYKLITRKPENNCNPFQYSDRLPKLHTQI